MTASVIWSASDPFLAARLRATATVRKGEMVLNRNVSAAMAVWLRGAKNAIYGLPNKLSLVRDEALTADAGDATQSAGVPDDALPNMNLWPDVRTWQLMLDTVVTPEVTKLFGKAFAVATRDADITDAHYVQAYVSTVSDRLSRNLWPDDVFNAVRGVIADGIRDGLSITHITENLADALSVDHYEWQARRIARTETIGASNAGTWNGASAYSDVTGEVMFKQWFATMDARVRADHAKAHHQVVPLDTDFTVGGFLMAYPASPDGPAREVCNCRCAMLILNAREAARWINPEDWTGDNPGPAESAQALLTETGASHAPAATTEDQVNTVTASTIAFAPRGVVIAPGSTPPVVQPPIDQSAGTASGGADVGSWYGVLAPLGTPSADGRMIAHPADGVPPRTRPLPIPLLYQDQLSSGHDGAFPVGLITAAWTQDGNLMGAGTFDMQDPRAAAIARKVATGNLGWVSVDLDDTTMEFIGDEGADPEVSVTSGMSVASDWRLMAATLVSQPAFPEAKISIGNPGDAVPELDPTLNDDGIGAHAAAHRQRFTDGATCDDPDCEYCGAPYAPAAHDADDIAASGCADSECACSAATAPTAGRMPGRTKHAPHRGASGPARPAAKPAAHRVTVSHLANPLGALARAVGVNLAVLSPDTGMPVADVGKAWDGPGAAKRVADYAKGSDGKITPSKYGKAFLWRDPDGDPTAAGSYKLGYADVVDGKLTIVPRGVYASAGALAGARTPLAVPAADKPAIRAALTRLYARVADAAGDDTITPPWKDNAKNSSSRVVHFAAGDRAPFAPPSSWFADPELSGPQPITITDDGRIFGHLASWGTCHTGFRDKCVTAPKSRSGYSYFHLGTVRTAEGDDVAVGTVHFATDHADTRAALPAAQRHYADTGCAGAVVRAGEDKYGIWVAGAVLPGADLVTLRHAPLSGDWRSVGGSMELVGALAVNQPGFPVPRPRWSTDDRQRVYALCAAGALAPADEACACCDPACADGAAVASAPAGAPADVMGQFIADLSDGLYIRAGHESAGAVAAATERHRRMSAAMENLGVPARRRAVASTNRRERLAAAMATIKKVGA